MTAVDYLKLCERPVKKITVPLFGDVHVRGLSAPEYDAFEHASARGSGSTTEFIPNTACLIRYGMVREDGSHIFSDEDLPGLANMPAEVSRPLRAEIMRLCGVNVDLGKS